MTPAMSNQTPRTTGSERLIETVDGVLFDLDGVVYRGDSAVKYAVEAINELETPTGYITNNASRPSEHVANHLRFLGLATSPDQVTTSAQAAAELIRDAYGPATRVLMIGGVGLHDALAKAELTVVSGADDDPEVVVQGTSQDITWTDLAEGVYAINAGATYVATNLDATMPTDRGMALGNGALVKAITYATEVEPTFTAGKPDPKIFHHAAQRANMEQPVVVGDRLDTDIAGARAAGYASLVVLPGVHQPGDIMRAPLDQRPDYMATDLRGLHQKHPHVSIDSDVWVCQEARAWAEGENHVVNYAQQEI